MPVEITQEGIEKIRAFILRQTGMRIEPSKDYVIRARLLERIAAVGAGSFQEYYHMLLFSGGEELPCFIESFTVNETYFFRDFPQLQGFADNVLPEYAEEKRRRGSLSLRLWSAACSIGCEPYTLSIILRECLDDFPQWDTLIEASDIDRDVLRKARMAMYDDRSVKDVPTVYRNKYFARTEQGWRLRAEAQSNVVFEHLNLIDRQEMRKKRGFDFIFCRNVLIYFDDDMRRLVVNHFYDALAPGGYLFLGSSESVGRISAAFALERKNGFLCYRKPPRP